MVSTAPMNSTLPHPSLWRVIAYAIAPTLGLATLVTALADSLSSYLCTYVDSSYKDCTNLLDQCMVVPLPSCSPQQEPVCEAFQTVYGNYCWPCYNDSECTCYYQQQITVPGYLGVSDYKNYYTEGCKVGNTCVPKGQCYCNFEQTLTQLYLYVCNP